MAIILKEGKVFDPPISKIYGADFSGSDFYGAIDSVEYDKVRKQCMFSVEIYLNKEARAVSKPISRENFNFNGESFDEKIGNDGLSIQKAYVIALETLEDWKSDEL